MDPKTRGKAKTRRKKPQMGEMWTFCEACIVPMLKRTRKVVTMSIVIGEGHSKEFGYNKG